MNPSTKDEKEPQGEARPSRWILQCHDAFPTDKMRKFLKDDGCAWDVYSLCKIIQRHLTEVFAPVLRVDERRAYELLKSLTHVLQMRNRNTHSNEEREDEDVDVSTDAAEEPAEADGGLTEDECLEALRLFHELALFFQPQGHHEAASHGGSDSWRQLGDVMVCAL